LAHARYHCHGSDSIRQLTDDYCVFPKKILGEGRNGSVVVATSNSDGRRYALKVISKDSVEPGALRKILSEVEIYLMLDHPNVAKLQDVYDMKNSVALVTECCEGGELFSRLADAGNYAENDAACATVHMLNAVGYLHAHQIVHRDLKPENFLYETKERNATLKLIDFGLAKIWDSSSLMKTACGTIAYASPDVLLGEGYTNKCDLWSIGVIVFMLLSGYPPFYGSNKEMCTKILNARVDWSYHSRWKNVSDDAMDFVNSLLSKDPVDRPGAKTALAHRWLCSNADASVQCGTATVFNRELLRSLNRYVAASKLQRAALQLLAHELSPHETAHLRDIFLVMDKNHEGTIRLSELKLAIRGNDSHEAYCAGQSSPKTPAAKLRRAKSDVINQVFSVLDAYGDEQIYFSVFVAATLNTSSQLCHEKIKAVFDRLDDDMSGTINAKDCCNVIGETFEGASTRLLFEEVAASSRNEMNYQDFYNCLKTLST